MRKRITADLAGYTREEIQKLSRPELLALCGEDENSNRPNRAMIRDLLKEHGRQTEVRDGLQIGQRRFRLANS